MLANKHIILGITGSIAAYKSALLIRELQKQKAQVQVVMTPDATKFITPLTLQTLSGLTVFTETFPKNNEETLAHIKLASDADLLLIAPATANTIAKMAAGIGDNLLSALYLASPAPVIVAPAMNCNMYTHPSTQTNINCLKERGVVFIEPATGELACGEEGPGRLAEIPDIIATVQQVLTTGQSLAGTNILITAGPTCEPIDELRFISNRSSGKMGYALAEEALRRGAQVTLVSGPTKLPIPNGADIIKVQTAKEMQEAIDQKIDKTQVLIMAAAVADYTPADPVSGKIKKSGTELKIKLSPTSDILAGIGSRPNKPFLVGFAAESNSLLENARQKLLNKRLDLIIANSIKQAGADENQVSILDKAENLFEYPLMSKKDCAKVILDKIHELIK